MPKKRFVSDLFAAAPAVDAAAVVVPNPAVEEEDDEEEVLGSIVRRHREMRRKRRLESSAAAAADEPESSAAAVGNFARKVCGPAQPDPTHPRACIMIPDYPSNVFFLTYCELFSGDRSAAAESLRFRLGKLSVASESFGCFSYSINF
jgi:hypothetical protein